MRSDQICHKHVCNLGALASERASERVHHGWRNGDCSRHPHHHAANLVHAVGGGGGVNDLYKVQRRGDLATQTEWNECPWLLLQHSTAIPRLKLVPAPSPEGIIRADRKFLSS